MSTGDSLKSWSFQWLFQRIELIAITKMIVKVILQRVQIWSQILQ